MAMTAGDANTMNTIFLLMPIKLLNTVMLWFRSYISSAPRLADQAFQPARVLLQKETDEQVNW